MRRGKWRNTGKSARWSGALGASNAFQLQGSLPEDRDALLEGIDRIIDTVGEERLRDYRENLRHL